MTIELPDNQSAGVLQALGLERRQATASRESVWSNILPWRWWRRRTVEGRWAIIRGVVMLAAVGLGFWGFQIACGLEKDSACKPGDWDIAYRSVFRTLQLLTSQFPPELPPNLPWQLQIARILLPIFTLLFTFDIVLAKLGRPFGILRLLRLRDHAVVIGAGDEAEQIARQLKDAHYSVAIVATPRDDTEAARLARLGVVISGDPKIVDTLEDARIYRARALFVLAGDDSSGVATVAAANVVCRRRRDKEAAKLQVVLALGRPDLRSLVSGQIVSAARDSGVELRLYVRETNVARALFTRFPPDWGLPTGAHDLHLAIVGVGTMGGELLMQAIRIAAPEPGKRLIVTLIDRDAGRIVETLRVDRPGIDLCCEMRVLVVDVRTHRIMPDDIDAWFGTAPPATSIYVCCGDDDANLTMAVGIRKAYSHRDQLSPPLFVYQRRGPALVNALPHLGGVNFDAFRVIPFGDRNEGFEPWYLLNDEIDRLAEISHATYLATLPPERRGAPAQKEWAELPETFRLATRARADHILHKMRRLGWHASMLPTAAAPGVPPGRLEHLAELEHERWSRERRLDGWTHDATRDDGLKHHPALVPYGQLDEAMKDLDRSVAVELVKSVQSLGLAVRADYRVGIWFHAEADGDASGPATAAGRALDRLRVAHPAHHLQVILPLRSPLELAIGETIHNDPEVPMRIEIGLISAGAIFQTDLDTSRERERAAQLIYGADRTFVLAAVTGEAAAESRALAALAATCDEVLVIATTHEMAQSLVKVGGTPGAKLTPVGALNRAD
jgi:voltage-gated potassium channel Kch